MSTRFQDFTTALRFRQAVIDIAESVVDRMRPTYRYATVQAINAPGRKVTVRFPGETVDVVVAAGSIIPSAVGQTVRIAGVGGERYVSDVLGDAYGSSPFIQPQRLTTNNAPVNITRIVAGESINRYMSTGFYNGDSIVGAPVQSWVYIQVLAHVNGSHWQRQICWDMQATGNRMWTRACKGGDPNAAGSWTAWKLVTVDDFDNDYREIGSAGNPGWENGWSHYGGDWERCGFMKDSQGFVHLKGLATGGTISTSAAAFTLPVGYRPGAGAGIHALSLSTAQGGPVRIWHDGRVTLGDPSAPAGLQGASSWFSLRVPPFRPGA